MGGRTSKIKSYSPAKAENPSLNKVSALVSQQSTSTLSPLPETPVKAETDYVEAVVCKESDMRENEMKIMKLGNEGEVLIVKQKGEIYALGTKCTHYGAPLDNAALGDGRIRCQWHGACFNLETGDIEDYPGLDSLPCYKVNISNGDVIVGATVAQLKTNKRVKPFTTKSPTDHSTFIIVGGGAAGNNCVETLRENGFTGRIVFIIGEKHIPYDRVKLSKALNSDVERIILRTPEYYKERQIETKISVQLTALNYEKKEVSLSNGEVLMYDKLFLATGASARHLPTPGSTLKNIFTLRTVEDANAISNVLRPDVEVVVLGASFIGMEVAAFCVGKVRKITVIGRENYPFRASLGEAVGTRILKFFEEKGVRFQLEQSIVEYRGIEGLVRSVILMDGREVRADVCIMGVGAMANTQYLADAGIELQRDRTIEVNEYLQTQMDGVYAGGDIAFAPVLGTKAAIGHWQLANYHGHIAALNMVGLKTKLNSVPFFWTMLFGKGFRYCGYAPKYDRVEIRGNIEAFTFVIFYVLDSEEVGAVLTAGRDPVASHFGELLNRGERLSATDIDLWLGNCV